MGVEDYVHYFVKMDAKEKLEFLIREIVETQKMITDTARVVGAWYERINEYGKELEAVQKALVGQGVRKAVTRDVLKGKVTATSDLFKKESDTVREYAKRLVMYS